MPADSGCPAAAATGKRTCTAQRFCSASGSPAPSFQ